MKIILSFTFCTLLLFQQMTHAQSDQGGFLEPADPAMCSSAGKICLPEAGYVFYDKPNGDYAGRISYNLPPYIIVAPGEPYATVQWRSIRPTLIDLSYFFETYDDRLHVPFDKHEAGFVRVMNGPSEGWISVTDIQQAGFKVTTWMDFYGEAGRVIAIPPGKTMPLRMSPYADGAIVAELDDEQFIIKVIPHEEGQPNCCEGQYCHVEAIQYKENPCRNGDYSDRNVVATFKGWLKIIDDTGKRVVMHHSGGC